LIPYCAIAFGFCQTAPAVELDWLSSPDPPMSYAANYELMPKKIRHSSQGLAVKGSCLCLKETAD